MKKIVKVFVEHDYCHDIERRIAEFAENNNATPVQVSSSVSISIDDRLRSSARYMVTVIFELDEQPGEQPGQLQGPAHFPLLGATK